MTNGIGASRGPHTRDEMTTSVMRKGRVSRTRLRRSRSRLRTERTAAGGSKVRVAVSTAGARTVASMVEMERVAAPAAPSAPWKGLSMKGLPAANRPSGSMALLLVLSLILHRQRKSRPGDWIDLSHACEVS